MATEKTTKETYSVKGSDVMKKIREIIKEGNARHIKISDKNGETLLNIPLTFGVVGAVIAPVLAAAGAVVALITECTITVERK
ncbi:MAG: DUF4342 domain-containing protein [Patescibacteria group bacterium]